MNENSSKQVLLSVLGIAVLVVAVVGVSFAFFTYSRAGNESNILTTGEIFFDFTESTTVAIENAFPGDEDTSMTFKIIGRNESTTDIDYTVSGIVQTPSTGQTAFQPNEVLMTIVTAETTETVPTNNYANQTAAPMEGTVELVKGKILAETEQNDVQEFTVKLAIADDVVISDTLASADYCSSRSDDSTLYDGTATEEVECASGKPEFDTLYYGLKISVEANATR